MGDSSSDSEGYKRAIRSFVRRAGRLTVSQQAALETLWPRYGVEPGGCLELDALFGRRAERYLEIGFGMGDALLEMAVRHPERDFLGIEVYEPGIGRSLRRLADEALENVRIIRGDAVDVLGERIQPATLAGVLIFFPDPWPKKRHHKRRLLQPEFCRLLASRLAPGGVLHLATDWEDYALQMLDVVDAEAEFTNVAGLRCFSPRPDTRPVTKFERRGARLGHGVWDLVYRRV